MHDDIGFRGKRLFLAIDLPTYTRSALTALRERLKAFHWVPPERFHLTLKFIGDVPGQFQADIESSISKIDVREFLLPIETIGRFPHAGKSHAVWAGVSSAHPRLFQLHKKIEDRLYNDLGIEPEKRIYHPHITLARVNHASEESVRQYLKRHGDFQSAPIRVNQFHLFRSELIEGKRVYTIERSWDLASNQTQLSA